MKTLYLVAGLSCMGFLLLAMFHWEDAILTKTEWLLMLYGWVWAFTLIIKSNYGGRP